MIHQESSLTSLETAFKNKRDKSQRAGLVHARSSHLKNPKYTKTSTISTGYFGSELAQQNPVIKEAISQAYTRYSNSSYRLSRHKER
mmetsp:Transcript_42434/g.40682  ORF Transcript_42434/g.40682 Transcript_42434/m.40682 type:complete len:87 (+) Transcript_42434:1779-2039(+)